MRAVRNGLGSIAIATAVLAVAPPAAAAEGVQVLRGSRIFEASTGDGFPDVVVLRGAHVGGAIPPPAPARIAGPAPRRREKARPLQVVIVPVVYLSTPTTVYPTRFWWRPSPHRSPASKWKMSRGNR